MTEAKRAQQFGFSADELNRAKAGLLAGYERAYKERETSESANYANEYVRHFLHQEPIPGHGVRIQDRGDVSADDHRRRSDALAQVTDHRRQPRRPGVAPEKKETPPPTTDTLRAAITRGRRAPVERWADATAGRELVEKPPAPGKVTAERTVPRLARPC